MCIQECEMDVGLLTQVTWSLYKGVALAASAGTTNGAGRWWWCLWWGVSGAHLSGQTVGVCSGSAGPIDAVAHLGVHLPGWVGESSGPSGGRYSDLPYPQNLYIFLMLELCCYNISWCWCTKCMCGMLLSPQEGRIVVNCFPIVVKQNMFKTSVTI